MIEIQKALLSLGIKKWVLRGEPANETEFNTMFRKVVGVDDTKTAIESDNPSDFGVTWDQIVAKQAELQADYDAKKYQRDRLAEYPSIQELVVALYDEEDKASIIERRNAVKAKYPKPE